MIVCENNNSIATKILDNLPYNQGGAGRHKCVICAYHHGIQDGKLKTSINIDDDSIEICKHGSLAPIGIISSIHENQKPAQGRHKCLICAYHIGFNQSISRLNELLRTSKITFGKLNDKSSEIDIINIDYQRNMKKNKQIKIDYLKEQRYKTELGLLGEKLVCEYEIQLGNNITHISLKDDSAGYDIKSKDNNTYKFIEVKTTTGSINKPFFISSNELSFLKDNQDNSFIYRVYNYDFTNHSADLKIIIAKDFLTKYSIDCQSYITIKG